MDPAELISRCAAEIEGAAEGEGAFSPGPALWAGRTEVAHMDSDGHLDVRLTKKLISDRRAALRADPRVILRRGTSDWLAVDAAADIDFAIALVRQAVLANLPAADPGPPPTGAELARRRRFH